MLAGIVREMLAVLQTLGRSAGDNERQILRRVIAGQAAVHAGAEDDHGVIEHRATGFLRGTQEVEQATEALEVEAVDVRELREVAGVAAVVGKLVVVFTATAVAAGLARPLECDDARGVGDEGEVAEFEHDIDPHRAVVTVAGLADELESGGIRDVRRLGSERDRSDEEWEENSGFQK